MFLYKRMPLPLRVCFSLFRRSLWVRQHDHQLRRHLETTAGLVQGTENDGIYTYLGVVDVIIAFLSQPFYAIYHYIITYIDKNLFFNYNNDTLLFQQKEYLLLTAVKNVVVNAVHVNGFTIEARARNHTVTIDQPEAGGGKNCGPNPLEYLFFSLAC